jgi:hypothetical protein
MPPPTPKRGPSEEIDIQKAINFLALNPHVPATDAATNFNVSYSKLRARKSGRQPSNSRGGHNKKLSSPQDHALQDYLLVLYHAGTPADLDHLVLASNRLLYYQGLEETVSRRWAKRWITRKSTFWKTLRSKPISAERRKAHIKEDVEAHFKEFQRCKDKWGILDEDIYNFDESGFQIGVAHGDRVIVPDDCEAVFITDPDNKELVTVVATVNPAAKKVPPMFIFKGAYHLRKHFHESTDPNILWARSTTGYTNDRLGLRYLKHFEKFTASQTVGAYRMLIFDGHGSHLTQQFVDYCWEHRIRPFRLPPHLTHVLQPCDVGFF